MQTMPTQSPRLEWGPQFRTGIKLIDEQHQVLFDLINGIEDHLTANIIDEGMLRSDIEGVVAYSMYHFVSEESLAYRLNATDDMERHLKGHNEFRRELASLKKQADDHTQLIPAATALFRYLKNWLTTHILRTDIELGNEIRRKSSASAEPDSPGHGPLRVAVVEGDRDLREEIVFFLSHVGHHAVGLESGAALNQHMMNVGSDVLVLDLGLPDIEGFDLLDRYADRRDVAIVVMTVQTCTEDRIAGYRHGADAYLSKPIDMRELVAVIDHTAQRLYAPAESHPDTWRLSSLKRRLFAPDGTEIELTELQTRLMLLFAPGRRTLQRTEIANTFVPDETHPEHALDERIETAISRLRRKFDEHGIREAPIKTVRGVGYLFSAPLLATD
jgi:hemerythrin-like metal-binding protein